MVAETVRRLFTVAEFQRMAAAGVFADDERVELIDGEIVEMTPIGDGHAGTVDGLNWRLSRRTPESVIVRVQSPLRLGARRMPQPDIALLRFRPDFYRTGHPEAADVLLVIEVADTSLRYDRRVKLPLYARSGIAMVWLVNLTARCVEVYAEPQQGRYTRHTTHDRGPLPAPPALPDLAVTVEEALG